MVVGALIERSASVRPLFLAGGLHNGRHVHVGVLDLHQVLLPVASDLVIYFFLQHAEFNDTVLVTGRVPLAIIVLNLRQY